MRVSSNDRRDELDGWVLETAPRAMAYALSLLRDRHQAEDVVQDCYCRLLAKRDVYDLPRDGLKLLIKSITNASINHQTRRRLVATLDQPVPDDEPSPDQNLMQRELEQAVAAGLERLPVTHRAALEMKSLGHSQQEIAEALGITVSHAGVLVHRARQSLAKFLAPLLGSEAVG
jgi:RNA polymerase sigma-70 factor (ECF subfamily)